jgi:mannose-6-phosphate isomerase
VSTDPGNGRVRVTIVPKPWGHETIWAHTDRYVGKILHIMAGHALSVQYHDRKDETIHLLSGEMIYRVSDRPGDPLHDVRLKSGESYRNTAGHIHEM